MTTTIYLQVPRQIVRAQNATALYPSHSGSREIRGPLVYYTTHDLCKYRNHVLSIILVLSNTMAAILRASNEAQRHAMREIYV